MYSVYYIILYTVVYTVQCAMYSIQYTVYGNVKCLISMVQVVILHRIVGTETFRSKSISITDCVKKCSVKESLGAYVLPPPGWTVPDDTLVQLTCTEGYSTVYGKNIGDL